MSTRCISTYRPDVFGSRSCRTYDVTCPGRNVDCLPSEKTNNIYIC